MGWVEVANKAGSHLEGEIPSDVMGYAFTVLANVLTIA